MVGLTGLTIDDIVTVDIDDLKNFTILEQLSVGVG